MNFSENLAVGRIAEGQIAKWLVSRGNAVMPAYEIEKNSGKGPQLFAMEGGIVSPDMVVFGAHGIHWVEAKRKTVFTWYRAKHQWETGIDSRHYYEYLKVRSITNLPVWLLFLHTQSEPWECDKAQNGCPANCPVGLFGEEIKTLDKKISHVSDRYAKGMVYWAHQDLKMIASLEELLKASSLTPNQ